MVQAERMLESRSLSTCMPESLITATYFHVSFTPDNKTLQFNVDADTQVSGNVTIQASVIAYGYNAFTKVISPCQDSGLSALCPMTAGILPNLESNIQIPTEQINQVPGKLIRRVLLPTTLEMHIGG
jgi:hypothetical protein